MDQSKMTKVNNEFFIIPDSKLGEGAFGEVHKGWWKPKNKIIAIKIVKAEEDYERQINVLKVLSTLIHPNIMGFYGYEHRPKQNTVFMFVEFCPNGDLTHAIKKGLSELQILKYFRQMVEGMCYMNAKNKIHRDLKPDNILIGPQNDLKISDFGLARQNENLMMTGPKGTPIYAGPEVYLMDIESFTQKCDVWGGGLIIYEMLTKQLLFKHVKTFPQLKQEWASYQKGAKRVKYNQNLHPLWEYFTNIMLTFDAKKRPTYHEVLQILKKVYNKMEKQISSKTEYQIQLSERQQTNILGCNPKLQSVENYLNFESQKYGLLVGLAQKYTQLQVPFKNSINYTIIFLCLSMYLTHMKKLIRDLKHKNITLPDSDDDIIEDQIKDYEIILCMDKYRNILDTTYTFYTDQIKTKIIAKLLKDHINRPDQQAFFSSIKDIVELMNDVSEGLFDIEDTYSEKLQSLVASNYVLLDDAKLSSWSEDALKLYIQILLSATLDQNFPSQKYKNFNFVKEFMDKIMLGNKNDFLDVIKKLKPLLK